ncbi:DUF6545 domain-containing protein [Streptomyces similanensis]
MSVTFWLIAVALGVGLCYKMPALLRASRNPMARQVAGLLAAGGAVFFFAAPSNIVRLNHLTGVPNFSAPWVYSLLTGFCASCLMLIVKWRGGTTESLRRTTWWVYGSYGALLVALWICFSLGDHHVVRTRDLDTYYATTPWMREMIVLYLLGHTVAVVITSALLWSWESRVRGTGWLRAGVVVLGVGYAANLGYDVTKLTPVIARWNGRTDLDWMSTTLAPPVAALVGLLIALGFILPHAGETASRRLAARREYWTLGPLARALRTVPAASSPVALSRFAPLQLRLTHRRTFVRDALRHLQPLIDTAQRDRDVQARIAAGVKPARAEALADAAAVSAAVERLQAGKTTVVDSASAGTVSDPITISRALRKLHTAPARQPRREGSVTTS